MTDIIQYGVGYFIIIFIIWLSLSWRWPDWREEQRIKREEHNEYMRKQGYTSERKGYDV